MMPFFSCAELSKYNMEKNADNEYNLRIKTELSEQKENHH